MTIFYSLDEGTRSKVVYHNKWHGHNGLVDMGGGHIYYHADLGVDKIHRNSVFFFHLFSFECEPCNCNGHSNKCHYNQTVDALG